MTKDPENIKRRFAEESSSKIEKKVKLTQTDVNQKNTELNDKDFQNTIKKIILHPDREKGIQLFKKAFFDDYSKECFNEDFENHIVDLAYQIENEIFQKNKSFQSTNYKQNIRTLNINLKVINKLLKLDYNKIFQFTNYLIGQEQLPIKIKKLITCDPKIFLSEENKEEFKKIQEEQIQSRNSDWHRNFLRKTAKASMNICIRCKSKNIDTRLQQTRSADEPMTEFHQCLDCGRQWKC